MTIWLAMLLGLVQGLCEFLPVSSSGHLVLLQTIFQVSEGALFFDTMLHVGTLVGVCAVYWEQLWEMLRHPLQRKVGLLLTSTAITAAMAFLARDLITAAFEGALLGAGFLATTIILLLTERVGMTRGRVGKMSYKSAALVGVMQGVAILPGISRSGSTIAGALFSGLDRRDASEYAFLLSVPAILGAAVMQVPDVLEEGITMPWGPVLAGMAVAAVSGYFSIRVMLKVILRRKLRWFAYYTLILGVLVLLDQFVFNVFFLNPLA